MLSCCVCSVVEENIEKSYNTFYKIKEVSLYMEEIWLPDEIQSIVQDKPCEKNNIGMSDSQVFMYEDMVLKIQAASDETENEVLRLPLAEGQDSCAADRGILCCGPKSIQSHVENLRKNGV